MFCCWQMCLKTSERFGKKHYELDPAHYYTAPGLAWAAMLKMTGVKLELLTDVDMLLMVERGMRGGNSNAFCRFPGQTTNS